MKTDRIKDEQTPVLIFSAQKEGGSTIQDLINNDLLVKRMQDLGIKFKTVIGGLDNKVTEISYVVNAKHRDFVLEQIKQFKQDSALDVDEFRNALLIDRFNSVIANLGKFKRAGKTQPKVGNWTYDINTKEYWQAAL